MNATKHQQNVIDGTIRDTSELARTTGRTLAVIEIDHDDERQIVAVKEEYLTDPEFEAFCGECLAVCRLNYNRAVQQTSREELLLNLERMRYHESEEFLGVSSITGQYTYTADLVARSIWPKNSEGTATLGAQSKPTIVYSPEQGSEFNQRKLSPVSLETLDLLASKGWAIDRVLRVTVRNLNDIDNATSAGGPTPGQKPDYEEFLYVTKLFRQLQLDHRSVEVGLEERVTTDSSKIGEPITLAHLSLKGEDMVTAAQQGYEFRLSNDNQSAELWKRPVTTSVTVLRFAGTAEASPEVAEICQTLELQPNLPSYRIRIDTAGQLKTPHSRRLSRHGLESGTPVPLKDEITMSTRSLKEMMFYLSHAVNAPPEHFRCGYVRSTFDDFGNPFNWNDMTAGLFHIHYSEKKPIDADVAVKHRGYWFYLSNCDLDSKSTFNLLQELINLEIRAGGGAQIPLLTI